MIDIYPMIPAIFSIILTMVFAWIKVEKDIKSNKLYIYSVANKLGVKNFDLKSDKLRELEMMVFESALDISEKKKVFEVLNKYFKINIKY